jgi:hypothetical protein
MRKDYDFTGAKRARDVPHLAKLQAEMAGKTRITMRVDNAVLAAFKARAESAGFRFKPGMTGLRMVSGMACPGLDPETRAGFESVWIFHQLTALANSRCPAAATGSGNTRSRGACRS